MNINNIFGYKLNLSARLMKRKLDVYVIELGITIPQWIELKVLSEEDNLMQVEIANRLNADIATIGATTDRLVKKGFVKKKRQKDDRRAYRISITDTGRTILENTEEKVDFCNQNALAGFSKDEIKQFFLYLDRVSNNLTGDSSSQEGEKI